MRIAIGCDHAGIELKPAIRVLLEKRGDTILDMGTDSSESVDYPEYAARVAHAVVIGTADRGILICGTGLGMAIAANKVRGARAVTLSEPYSARMARAHNDANIMTLGSRVIGPELAQMIVETFLTTDFEGGRHQRRVAKLETPSDTGSGEHP
ncbi:ribose 5-phosphate isomerase B [bacterium]|nr:ribose 5-phosphate isomerase B [candidate division CSSED10-310 bacterium]